MIFRLFILIAVLAPPSLIAQIQTQTINGWQMQDAAKVAAVRGALRAVDARRRATDLCAAPKLSLDTNFLAGLALDFL